jgi:hypothetical protein
VGGNTRRRANTGSFRHAEAERGKQLQGNRIARIQGWQKIRDPLGSEGGGCR